MRKLGKNAWKCEKIVKNLSKIVEKYSVIHLKCANKSEKNIENWLKMFIHFCKSAKYFIKIW